MESKSYDSRSERGKIKFCNTVSTSSTSRLHPIHSSICDSVGGGRGWRGVLQLSSKKCEPVTGYDENTTSYRARDI